VTGARALKILHTHGKAARQNAHFRCATRTWMKPYIGPGSTRP